MLYCPRCNGASKPVRMAVFNIRFLTDIAYRFFYYASFKRLTKVIDEQMRVLIGSCCQVPLNGQLALSVEEYDSLLAAFPVYLYLTLCHIDVLSENTNEFPNATPGTR